MTLSPRVTLALALAAGLAVPALAQTASPNATPPANGENSWNAQHPQSSYATQPQANYGAQPQGMPAQPQPGDAQPQASNMPAQPNGQTSPISWQGSGSQANMNGQMPPGAPMQGPENGQVSQAQAQLRAAGLYNGPQDGVMDPDTRAAIARFQEQHGLQRTERLDPQTMAALSSNQTMGSGSSTAAPSGMAPSSGNAGQAMAPTGAGGTSGNAGTGQPYQR